MTRDEARRVITSISQELTTTGASSRRCPTATADSVSFVSTSQQQLILDLLLGKLGEQEFYARYPTNATDVAGVGLNMLERGLRERDPVAVEFGLYIAHRFGVTPPHVGVLNALAVAPWHERHEDAVSALAKLRDVSSVEPLHQAALLRPAYLEYDAGGLRRRLSLRYPRPTQGKASGDAREMPFSFRIWHPLQRQGNEANGWDDEASSAFIVVAESEEAALKIGAEAAEGGRGSPVCQGRVADYWRDLATLPDAGG